MNVVTRGVKNALRNPLRTGAISLMLAISIGLILAMLVARSSVLTKIDEVKANTASTVTVTPAGIRGGFGGGDPLTADQLATITKTAHVKSVTGSLTDQLGTDDTSLTPSLELGSFGRRMQRFEGNSADMPMAPDGAQVQRRVPTPRTSVTGTTNPNSLAAAGGTLTLTSGTTIDGNSSDLVALVGTTLAAKNNLAVGSTFTAYGKTVTVKGIYKTGNTFEDSGVIMPLSTLQTLTTQPGAVTSAIVAVDTSDNVKAVASSLTSSLSGKADVTSEADRVANSLTPLENISSLALGGVIGATIAGATIILLTMVMIVRERRREIGVIKAIGGTNFKVVGQFITEALTLTIIGATLGLIIGTIASGPMTQSLVQNEQTTAQAQTRGGNGPRAIFRGGFAQARNNIRQVTGTLTPQVFAISIAITLLIAIIGSAIPAWFIARIRPAEVLRTE